MPVDAPGPLRRVLPRAAPTFHRVDTAGGKRARGRQPPGPLRGVLPHAALALLSEQKVEEGGHLQRRMTIERKRLRTFT